MENVSSILVDMYAVYFSCVCVTADVWSFIYNQHAKVTLSKQTSQGGSEEPGTNN